MGLKAIVRRIYSKTIEAKPSEGQVPRAGHANSRATLTAREPVLRGAVALMTVLMLGYLFWPVAAHAGLGAQPGYVFVNLSKGNPSGRFIVSNTGKDKQTYRAQAIHFALTKGGSITPIKPDEYSLAPWIKFNPKEFTLPPNSSRVIRFTIIRDESRIRQHEYRGAIEFTPLNGASFKSKADKKGRSMEFKVITALLIPIYGEMPGTVYGGRISDIGAEQTKKHLSLSATVKNTGGGSLRATGSWQISSVGTDDVIKTVPVQLFTVFPAEERYLTTRSSDTLPPGRYTVKLSLKYHHGKTLSDEGVVDIR